MRLTGIPASVGPITACCGALAQDRDEFDTEILAGWNESVTQGLGASAVRLSVRAPVQMPEGGPRGLAYGKWADGRRFVSFRGGDVVLTEIDVLDVVAGV
jgi:hypothetical protein